MGISFGGSIEEVTRRFKRNAALLKEHMGFVDKLAQDLGIDQGALERNQRLLEKAEEKLGAYKELTSLQGAALRRLCSLCQMKDAGDTYTPLADTEYFLV